MKGRPWEQQRQKAPCGSLALVAVTTCALVACAPEARRSDAPASLTPAALEGVWQGLTHLEGQEIRVEVEIRVGSDGEPSGFADFRDGGALGVPVGVSLVRDSVSIASAFGPLIAGRLSRDLETLGGRFFVATLGSWRPLTLVRNNPKFRRFEVPRITDDGHVRRDYAYRSPAPSVDGWPVSSLAAESIDEGPIAELVEDILGERHGRPEAILIARNGRLVLEEYFYGYSRTRMHSVQSVTKSVTSLLLGIAKDRGQIGDLDQPVHTFFPEHAGRRWIDEAYPITLAHLLTMSAGVEWKGSSDPDRGEAGWERLSHDDDWIGYVLDLDPVDEPGRSASYNSGLSVVLGGIIRNVTGLYVDELAEETLFADLGVTKYRWMKAADGTRETGGGLTLTAYDLAKMGQVVLDGGVWKGRRVLSDAWITESVGSPLPVADGSAMRRHTTGYAYHWWRKSYQVRGAAVPAIVAAGYGGQYLGIFPTLDAVVVFLNGEWDMPSERVFDYDAIVEERVLPALR